MTVIPVIRNGNKLALVRTLDYSALVCRDQPREKKPAACPSVFTLDDPSTLGRKNSLHSQIVTILLTRSLCHSAERGQSDRKENESGAKLRRRRETQSLMGRAQRLTPPPPPQQNAKPRISGCSEREREATSPPTAFGRKLSARRYVAQLI